MPIIWRYLISQYLKVLFFCTIALIAVLLTTRLDEIAHFAALGPQGYYVFLFILYQIPYILPIAIPISSLISAIILIQRLSNTHELTALRAAGFALREILTPILLVSACISLLNFYIVSDMATSSHMATGILKNELRSVNPLLLLNNRHLMRLKGVYFDTMGPSRIGEFASEAILATPNKRNGRINLLTAKNLQASPSNFIGRGVTLVSSMPADEDDEPDHIVLENIEKAKTSIKDFTQMVQNKVWTLNNDHMKLSLLLLKLKDEQQTLEQETLLDKPSSDLKQISRNINRVYSEIVRRISAALAVFTFTLMGAAFGVNIGRYHKSRGLFVVIGLATFYLIAFFAAKGIDHLITASALLYLIPHLLIIFLSLWVIKRATKGIE